MFEIKVTQLKALDDYKFNKFVDSCYELLIEEYPEFLESYPEDGLKKVVLLLSKKAFELFLIKEPAAIYTFVLLALKYPLLKDGPYTREIVEITKQPEQEYELKLERLEKLLKAK